VALVRRAPGEPELFAVLFRRYGRDVHRFVWRRTRNDMLADDITAVTFEKCWRALPSFRPRLASVRPWLFRIAANELASHFRSEQRRGAREHLAVVREEPLRPAQPATDPGGDPALLAAMSRLSERDQVVLSLRFLADLGTEESAEALGVSRGHVAVLQHRALGALRRELEGATDDR
jgi:RNA polymerase sigma-70 factor (ECF subfamily)